MNIMLVDDNYQILEFLDQSIDWESEGFSLVAKCENGMEALEIARAKHIDIVVTDIDMPKMNGLDLIKEIKEVYPSIQSIIVSNYDEFKYAQKAIQLLVDDYILKDDLNPDSLLETLQEITEKSKEKNKMKMNLMESEIIIKQNRLSIKRQFIRDVMNNRTNVYSDIIQQLEKYGIHFTKHRYIPIIGKVHNIHQSVQKFGSADTVMIAVDHMLKEFFTGKVESFVYDQYEAIWFYCIDDEKMYEQTVEFQQLLKQYFQIDLPIIYGRICSNVSEFVEHVKQLADIEINWFYMDGDEISAYEQMKSHHLATEIYDIYEPFKEGLKQIIHHGNIDEMNQKLRELFDQYIDISYHPKTVKGLSHKVIVDVCVDCHLFDTPVDFHMEQIHIDISTAKSMNELRAVYEYYLEQFIHICKKKEKSYHPEVWKALRYIDENIEKKLTLNMISENLYLNPTYFSRLFKKDTGKLFVDYIAERKMEKAQVFLKNTNLTIESISFKLGYSNPSYFIKQFKRFHKQTPVEFRNVQ